MLADFGASLQDESFGHRTALVVLNDIVAFAWARVVLQWLRPGAQRLTAAAPIFATSCALPLLFSRQEEIVTRGSVAFLHVWLLNTKVLSSQTTCRPTYKRCCSGGMPATSLNCADNPAA